MARLPDHDSVSFDIAKLTDYCLNPHHLQGKHKARVFRSALGIGRSDAAWLRGALLEALPEAEAESMGKDRYGKRWRIDVTATRQRRVAVVRSAWIMRTGERTLRFVTCWVR
jgi:hypothetical protein